MITKKVFKLIEANTCLYSLIIRLGLGMNCTFHAIVFVVRQGAVLNFRFKTF